MLLAIINVMRNHMVLVIKEKYLACVTFSCSWRSILNGKNWPRCFISL